MVPQAKTRMQPRLSGGDLTADIWQAPRGAWLKRWSPWVERQGVAPDVARYTGSFEVDSTGLVCAVTWTFCDERLTSISVRPAEGRVAIDLLLVRLGVDLSMLVPAGDGLFSIEAGGTHFDVDRLDGVVSLQEVCT